MKDVLDSFARGAADAGIPDVPFDQFRFKQILTPAGRKVVQHPHPGTPYKQRVRQVRPDEPSAAGHQHGNTREIRNQAFTTLSFFPRYTPRVSTISGAWRATSS
ncbi:MAG: hypothetical protein QOH06_24 [Acidobacteriota bacterium]|nr:hypothetical protein [Acidobacteriota bacterium]